MKQQIILIATLFLLVACGQRNDKGTGSETQSVANDVNMPVDNALTFINSYIEDCNKMNESVGYLTFVNFSSLTTDSFKTELKRIVDEAKKKMPK